MNFENRILTMLTTESERKKIANNFDRIIRFYVDFEWIFETILNHFEVMPSTELAQHYIFNVETNNKNEVNCALC